MWLFLLHIIFYLIPSLHGKQYRQVGHLVAVESKKPKYGFGRSAVYPNINFAQKFKQ